ncbi:unnamed protein product, partial [Chrysoparadoxa australica]
MSRVWVKQSFVSHSEVQVLLLPLGDIPVAKFSYYCGVLKQLNVVRPSQPSGWSRQSSPLRHFSWDEGSFKFHFIDTDTTDGGLSDWGDYQAHRRILGVIGIVHAPSCMGYDFPSLEKELSKSIASCPDAVLTRIWVFEQNWMDMPAMEGYDNNKTHLYLPEERRDLYWETWRDHLCNVAAEIMTLIESSIKTYESHLGSVTVRYGVCELLPPLTSPYEREEAVTDSRRSKRRLSRLHKWVADLCLLCGSPKDGFEHYKQALQKLEKDDDLWQAGALEGYAASLVAMSDPLNPFHTADIFEEITATGSSRSAGEASTWTTCVMNEVDARCRLALDKLDGSPSLYPLYLELCFK